MTTKRRGRFAPRWKEGLALTTTVVMAIGVLASAGCFASSDSQDDEPPAAPRGVVSISGDGEVILRWYPNGERDLAGYEVWRSDNPHDNYEKIATVSQNVTEYRDRDVRNGKTYYYAVLAFDEGGNKSDFNPDLVEDTPRPEGFGVTLYNYRLNPNRAGFAFANASAGAIPRDRNGDDLLDRDVDVFFGFDDEVNIAYLYSDHDDLFMQDLGYHEDMNDVDVAPTKGYTTVSVEMLEGHVYAFYTPDGHYAKIRVRRVSPDSVTFDWAYQLQRDNTDLAPSLRVGTVTRGRPRPR